MPATSKTAEKAIASLRHPNILMVMEAGEAEKRGLEPLGIYRGMAVAGIRMSDSQRPPRNLALP